MQTLLREIILGTRLADQGQTQAQVTVPGPAGTRALLDFIVPANLYAIILNTLSLDLTASVMNLRFYRGSYVLFDGLLTADVIAQQHFTWIEVTRGVPAQAELINNTGVAQTITINLWHLNVGTEEFLLRIRDLLAGYRDRLVVVQPALPERLPLIDPKWYEPGGGRFPQVPLGR